MAEFYAAMPSTDVPASSSGKFRLSSREQSSGGLAGNTSTTWVRPDDATATSRDLSAKRHVRPANQELELLTSTHCAPHRIFVILRYEVMPMLRVI